MDELRPIVLALRWLPSPFESVEGQSRNTFQGDNKNSLFSNQQRELVMMNPFLSVSDSGGIKGGAGDSLSPSLSSV